MATAPADRPTKTLVVPTVGGWIQERTHIVDGLLPIIQRPVPKGINWWYVLGSATLLAFINQVITGVALAMTYVPARDQAYQSLNFITHKRDNLGQHLSRLCTSSGPAPWWCSSAPTSFMYS